MAHQFNPLTSSVTASMDVAQAVSTLMQANGYTLVESHTISTTTYLVHSRTSDGLIVVLAYNTSYNTFYMGYGSSYVASGSRVLGKAAKSASTAHDASGFLPDVTLTSNASVALSTNMAVSGNSNVQFIVTSSLIFVQIDSLWIAIADWEGIFPQTAGMQHKVQMFMSNTSGTVHGNQVPNASSASTALMNSSALTPLTQYSLGRFLNPFDTTGRTMSLCPAGATFQNGLNASWYSAPIGTFKGIKTVHNISAPSYGDTVTDPDGAIYSVVALPTLSTTVCMAMKRT